jgi:hypothetical protein
MYIFFESSREIEGLRPLSSKMLIITYENSPRPKSDDDKMNLAALKITDFLNIKRYSARTL